MLFCASCALGADAVLDQSIAPVGPYGIAAGIDNLHTRAQTFTVGITGKLTRFDVDIAGTQPNLPVLWDIRRTVAGVPVQGNFGSLAFGSFPSSNAPSSYSFFTVNLGSGGLAVSEGEVLALVFRNTDPSGSTSIAWDGDTTNPYSRGAAYDGTPAPGSTTWSSDFINYDFGLKTYVVPVPEPSLGWLCLALGICQALERGRSALGCRLPPGLVTSSPF